MQSDFSQFEDKQVTILRRKFLVGIPTFSLIGFLTAKMVSSHFGFSKWPRRTATVAGLVLTPIIGSIGIVHFNRAEIFRVGNTMMRQMEELRRMEEGPFKDPSVRAKWDEQINSRQFKSVRIDENIASEYASGVDYSEIVNDSVRK
jgi:hypothetical protein